jgi:hypothetical protein
MRITEHELAEKVKEIPNGMFFSITFRKKDGTIRNAVGQKGVTRPKDARKTPKGTGVSAREALEKGLVKFYEPHHKNDDGTVTGEYRQADIRRVLSLTAGKTKFIVTHKENEA